MAIRTTGVRLEADVRPWKRGMQEGKRAVEDLEDSIHDTRTESDRLGESMGKTGKSSGSAFKQMKDVAEDLDEQITVTRKNIAALGTAYAMGGDPAVMKQIKEQQRSLKELRSTRSLLPSASELAEAGADAGKSILAGVRTTFANADPKSIGAGLLGAAMVPTLGAAISGAVVGGIGIGGVAGGLAIAARDQRVKDAGKDLGRFIMGDLTARASGFVEPTLSGIVRIRQGWQALGPDLDKIFKASRFIDPLADGMIKGARGIVSGIADAIENADPAIEAFQVLFDEVGNATGDLFRTMGEDADEGAMAINDLTGSIVSMIQATEGILHATAQVRGFNEEVDKGVDSARYWLEDHLSQKDALFGLERQLDLTADGFKKGSAEAEAYRRATLGTATAADLAMLKSAGLSDQQLLSVDASGRYRVELAALKDETYKTAAAMGTLIATEDDVKDMNDLTSQSQKDLAKSIEMMNPSMQRATLFTNNLKTATQQLYGAQEMAIDANESFEASWDGLSTAIKGNKGSLDLHTEAGRKNRDALQDLLKSSRDMYFADVNSGTAVDEARKKHEKRTEAIRKESIRLGLNKKGTDELIDSYGRIPAKRQTDIIQAGVDKVVKSMMDLYVYQRSLAEGLPIATVTAMLRDEKGPAKRYGGYHEGGHTGHGGKYEPAGIVHREEFVMRSEATKSIERQNPGVLAEMNATGQIPGYAGGGWVGAFPVDARDFRVPVTAKNTKIPTRQQVADKVGGSFGNAAWPSSPSAVRGDSGRWRKIKKFLEDQNMGGSFGNGYRPGDPKWHGSGWAVDWMGYNQDRLASKLANMKPLELIHRTNQRDYAYTRGKNKGSFNESLMNAHRNHIHIAMADGGVIREPVLGVGASGRTYSFGENYRPEEVRPLGKGSSGGGGVTIINLTINSTVGQHPSEIGKQVVGYVGQYLERGGTLVLSNGTKVL